MGTMSQKLQKNVNNMFNVKTIVITEWVRPNSNASQYLTHKISPKKLRLTLQKCVICVKVLQIEQLPRVPLLEGYR